MASLSQRDVQFRLEGSAAGPGEGRAVSIEYRSFDGGVRIFTARRQPDRYRALESSLLGRNPVISRGAGLSYAAASFGASAVSIEHTHFDRLLAFDAANQTIEVESGTQLGKIYEFLAPRGFFLSVQPGHPKITIGGCIGADVHGKNQFRDGTFSSQVVSLRLLHPSYGILEVSPAHERELFALTCGGYGLTGSILSAKLKVAPIESATVRLRHTTVENIYALPHSLQEAASRSDLVYSWHECTAKGKHFGRGVVVEGSFAPAATDGCRQEVPIHPPRSSLNSATRGRGMPPFFNSITTPLFNRMYRTAVRLGEAERVVSLYELLFPVHNKELYFNLFGRRGFHEYQIIIPLARYEEFMSLVQAHVEKEGLPITLASGKLFKGTQELLRFTGNGICFCFNFPRCRTSLIFAEYLDMLAKRFEARPNLIKDSRLPAHVVADTYPEYERFRKLLKIFDSDRLYRSELSDRLQL